MLKAIHETNKPLAEQVAEQIQHLIATNDINKGEKLPNEFELAGSLNVGRGTIREAVKILVSRNVLEIRRGKGTFVSQQPGVSADPYGLQFYEDQSRLMNDLLQIRFMLEPQIAALAAEHATSQNIEEMKTLNDMIMEQIQRGERYIETDIQLHNCWARSTQNQIIPNLLPTIQRAISLFFTTTDRNEWLASTAAHQKIIDAIEAHDPERARQAMIEHLSFNQKKLQMIQENGIQ